MDITLLDYLVFFVFVSGVVLFGCSFYFRSRKGAAAFTSAEGTLPTWVVGMSIFATFVSSISFLGLPGDAYKGKIFEMTDKGEIKNSRIVHTVIKSDRRFTYEEAQQIIETKEGDFKEEILKLDALAKILREKRFAAGAINFDRYEVKFEIDEKGKPINVYFKESKDANKLVEEFMLLANRTVAEKIGRVPKSKKPKVFPYRIHDLPDRSLRVSLYWLICPAFSKASEKSFSVSRSTASLPFWMRPEALIRGPILNTMSLTVISFSASPHTSIMAFNPTLGLLLSCFKP